MAIEKLGQIALVRKEVHAWRRKGKRVGLVPTMGALHAGHLSLVKEIAKHADKVVVSIFVNPKQFGEGEDFEHYPRDLAGDLKKLEKEGADLAFTPAEEAMYPKGFRTTVSVAKLTRVLCGVSRPGHFDGVTTVVAKLLNQVGPDCAIFGEKDYQQLLVIKQMARDLDLPVEILSAPTVREKDGLALSSRNVYLSEHDRRTAALLPKALKTMSHMALEHKDLRDTEKKGRQFLLSEGFTTVDYVEFRSGKDLSLAERIDGDTRIFAAVHLGKTRLIDNMPVKG